MATVCVSDYALARLGQGASGAVHSVFASSFNVELDGFLLHVGGDSAPLSCLGASMSSRAMDQLLAAVERGDQARYRSGVLRIYSRACVSELSLSDAPARGMRVPCAPTFPDGADILLGRVVSGLDLACRCGLPWSDGICRPLADLARFSVCCLGDQAAISDEAREASTRAMRGSVAYLMGRGLGLTPSGDDVLCGYGVALRYLHGERAPESTREYFDAVSRMLPGRTTAVSEAYLTAMVDGYANEDVLALVAALAAGNERAAATAAAGVLNLGHTSGADILLGFSAAFGCLWQVAL